MNLFLGNSLSEQQLVMISGGKKSKKNSIVAWIAGFSDGFLGLSKRHVH